MLDTYLPTYLPLRTRYLGEISDFLFTYAYLNVAFESIGRGREDLVWKGKSTQKRPSLFFFYRSCEIGNTIEVRYLTLGIHQVPTLYSMPGLASKKDHPAGCVRGRTPWTGVYGRVQSRDHHHHLYLNAIISSYRGESSFDYLLIQSTNSSPMRR